MRTFLALALWTMTAVGVLGFVRSADGYPPAVGILGEHRTCIPCHSNTGPWNDEQRTIVDILDASTKKSLSRGDGTFLIEVRRGEKRTVLTVMGRAGDEITPPKRNAWLYVDSTQIGSSSLSKFAPGWDVNLPMSCRLVGDRVEGYEGAYLTVLPMTIRPSDAARDGELELQMMLTMGESVKGNAKTGLVSNYLVRRVLLRVQER